MSALPGTGDALALFTDAVLAAWRRQGRDDDEFRGRMVMAARAIAEARELDPDALVIVDDLPRPVGLPDEVLPFPAVELIIPTWACFVNDARAAVERLDAERG